MQIYIANLDAYNEGKLIGEWADALDLDEIEAVAEKVSEEYVSEEGIPGSTIIHDYEDMPSLGERSDWEKVHEIAEFLADHGSAAEAYIDLHYGDPDVDRFVDTYYGNFEDEEDLGYNLLEDQDIPSHLEGYIDYERYGRDALISDLDGHVYDGQLYVWYSR